MAAPTRSPAPARGATPREALLRAGLEVFGEYGLAGATVRRIAQRAGQNIASISYYFHSKEKLYHAVLEWIVAEMRRRIAYDGTGLPTAAHVEALTPDEALAGLKAQLRVLLLRVSTREDTLPVSRLVVREQLRPSPAFDILYQGAIGPIHERITRLLARAAGGDPAQRETILRAQLLIGQVFGFMMARATICRRLGVATVSEAGPDGIAALLDQHVAWTVHGLRAANARRKRKKR